MLTWYQYNQGQLIKTWPAKTGGRMTVNEFALKVAKEEGKKRQVNIGQIKELLRVINSLVDGTLYRTIRKM